MGNGALIPLELCVVIKGQLARRQVPPQSALDMVRFASKRPDQRLAKIRDAPRVIVDGFPLYVYEGLTYSGSETMLQYVFLR